MPTFLLVTILICIPVCLNAKTLYLIFLNEKAEVLLVLMALCLQHYPFGFSLMPGKFIQTKLLPGAAAALAPAGLTRAATGLPCTAAGLAGASEFLLEAEETACTCTTVCVSLSLTNWRESSEAGGPESS